MIISYDAAADIVRSVISYFRRRGVRQDPNEMWQDAWVGLLSALETYDPERGAVKPYVWRAAFLHLSKQLWKRTAVSVKWYDYKEAYETVHTTSIEKFGNVLQTEPNAHADEIVGRKMIREQMACLVETSLTFMDAEDAALGLAVLDGERRSDVSKATGAPIRNVYKSVRKVKNALIRNRKIQRLWKESK